MELDRVQLLGQPRLEDVDLAGAVQQRIEQPRIDARRFRALGARARRAAATPRAAAGGGERRRAAFRSTGWIKTGVRLDDRRFLAHEPFVDCERFLDRRLLERSRPRCGGRHAELDLIEPREIGVRQIDGRHGFVVRCRGLCRRAAAVSGGLAGAAARALDRRRCRRCLARDPRRSFRAAAMSPAAAPWRAAGVDGVAHLLQLVESALHEVERRRRRPAAPLGDARQQRLERVAQVAHRQDAGHARAALQRVQEALQHGDGGLILALPHVLQRGFGVVENLRGFLGEDRGDLRIEGARFAAARRRRRGAAGCAAWLPPRRRPAARETRAHRATRATAGSGSTGAAGRQRVGHPFDFGGRGAQRVDGRVVDSDARLEVAAQVLGERRRELHRRLVARHAGAAEQRVARAIERLLDRVRPRAGLGRLRGTAESRRDGRASP